MSKYAIVRILDDKAFPWGEFRTLYLATAKSRMRPKTVRCLIEPTLKSFEVFAHSPELGSITPVLVSQWLASISSNSQNTISIRLNTLRFILNYAVKLKMLSENPAAGVPRPAVQFKGRALSDSEIILVLRRLPPEVSRAAQFSLFTGLRIGEILSLTWGQISRDTVFIPSSKSKSKKGRTIALHPEARKLLLDNGIDRAFKVSRSTIEQAMRSASRWAGIGRVTFHAWRHTCITRYFEKTGDTPAAMDTFGWANEAAARPYQHITDPRKSLILNLSYDLGVKPLDKLTHGGIVDPGAAGHLLGLG